MFSVRARWQRGQRSTAFWGFPELLKRRRDPPRGPRRRARCPRRRHLGETAAKIRKRTSWTLFHKQPDQGCLCCLRETEHSLVLKWFHWEVWAGINIPILAGCAFALSFFPLNKGRRKNLLRLDEDRRRKNRNICFFPSLKKRALRCKTVIEVRKTWKHMSSRKSQTGTC